MSPGQQAGGRGRAPIPSATLTGVSLQRTLMALAGAAIAALLVIGLIQLGDGNGSTPRSHLSVAQMRARLRGSPAPLESLHAQANQILQGGLSALRRRLASLRGRPIVINKWASWCQPCRTEFGAFQQASVARGRQVAFLGIDSGDTSRADAAAFLRTFPVSYPSYYDPSGQIGQSITESGFTPATVFIDPRGRRFVQQGPFPTAAKLERAIELYALDKA